MNYYQLRVELQGAINQWIDSLMKNNDISASMMDDALSKVLLSLREQAAQEYLAALQSVSSKQSQNIDGGQNEQTDNTDRVEQ